MSVSSLSDKVEGGDIPKEYIPAIKAGVEEALDSGVIAGYPVVDVKVTLKGGSFHEVDSSEMAFKMAGAQATQDGCAARCSRLSRSLS